MSGLEVLYENVLAFNESFWIRLVARTDTCKSKEILYLGSNLVISLSSTCSYVIEVLTLQCYINAIEKASDIRTQMIRVD